MAFASSFHRQCAFSGIEPPNNRREIEVSSRVFDVFINHRGPDVKQTLAIWLYNSLKELGIETFLDSEEKELGSSFPSTIETAIASASVHIAIFSKRYADSPWCLAELILMLRSKAKIIPLFYQVEPWELRYIEKGVYAEAFLKYAEKGRYLGNLKQWREALQQVSYTTGYELKNSESSDCAEIVFAVEKEVQRTKRLHVAKYPVGLHKLVKDFERRCLQELVQDFEILCGMKKAGREKANVVGIFGMGGVGKTTLSKELFNQMIFKYPKRSFLFDVRETCATGKLPLLQSKLLNDIFCEGNHSFQSSEQGKSCLSDRFKRNRSLSFLIVLDDIDHVEQLDALLPMETLKEYGDKHHLIIITTRDVGVLVSTGINIAYHLKGLGREYGRELFCWHAFKQSLPVCGYEDLVEAFVKVCGGLPLSLIVLGRHVSRRPQWYWQDELEKLKETLPGDIKKRLMISLDTLDNVGKQIFMDISCFFIGKSITKAMTIWKGSGWGARHALETLKEKCLVEVQTRYIKDKWESSTDRFVLGMHDHLRDLGREMANELSHPRRVWHPQALKSLEPKGFRNILAQIKCRCFHSILDESINCKITYFLREPEDGSDTSLLWLQLEYLKDRAPFLNPVINSSIFSWIPVHDLQYLGISHGHFKKLWQSDVQVPLKRLQIRDTFLEELPSLDRVSCLEQIEIRSCQKLQRIMLPPTLIDLDVQACNDLQRVAGANPTGLTQLIIKQCHALEELPSLARVSCLEKIEIESCEMLQNLLLPRALISLSLQNCRDLQRVAVADDITKLTLLIIKQCPALKEFPSLTNVSFLKEIEIGSCEKLENIILPRTLISLSVLSCKHLQRIEGTSNLNLTHLIIKQCPVLEEFPSLAGVNCLKEIMIDSWEKLQNITLPTTLIKLHVQRCSNLERIAGTGDLTNLRELIIKQCSPLQSIILPMTLTSLSVQSCRDLKRMDATSDLRDLTCLIISNCPDLEELPSLARLGCLEEIMIDSSEKLRSITLPKTLIKLHVQSCRNLERIAVIGDPTNLRQLIIKQCPALGEFPSLLKMSCLEDIEIASYEKLQNIIVPTTLMSLSVQSCRDLRRIEGAGDLRDLTHLIISNCPQLEDLPNLSRMSRLMILGISYCKKMQNVAGIEKLNALQSMQLLYNNNAAIENCIPRLKRVLSRRTDLIGRAADGTKSILNESLFSDAHIEANAVTDIVTQTNGDVDFDFNYWWVKWKVIRAVVIGCFLVIVDSSNLVEDINKLLPDCYDYGYGVKVRQGEWIITIIACDYSSYYYIHLISNVLRRYGVAKKGFRVEVNETEEWKSVGVIQTIADRLYHL